MEASLLAFTEHFYPIIEGKPFLVNHHHKLIADALEKVERGEIKNLLINMPPRYSKTELAVKNWIARCIAVNPAAKFIHLSYSDELVLDNSAKIREIIKSEEYQSFWPVQTKDDSDSKKKWYTVQGGGVYATHASGAVTGFGAGSTVPTGNFDGAIVIDDPLKADDANSDIERQKVNDRLINTIQSRRDNPSTTPIIIIMQRLHQDDMSGFVLAGKFSEEFYHLDLPACNEDTQEVLWPAKHSFEQLMALKKSDKWMFASQYQQTPVPRGGGMIKDEWYKGRFASPPANPVQIVQSWDTAQKAKELNDYSVCTTWFVYGGNYYLIDLFRKRMEFPELKKMAKAMAAKHKPHAVLIEDKSSGTSLIQDLKADTSIPIIAIEPCGDKVTRMSACSALIEAGKVFLPQQSDWLPDFELESTNFPAVKHDDQIDSMSQFLNWIRERGESSYSEMMDRIYG